MADRRTHHPFRDLREFIAHLERIGQLKRVRLEVDPVLEVTEIVQRVVRENGPALLFERPKGAAFPLAINLFGSLERIELALGRHPQEIGQELVEALGRLNPLSLRGLWASRRVLRRGLATRPKIVSRAPVQDISEAPDLDRLPILKCWPLDGGRFITFGAVLTEHPVTGRRNFGLYRLHVYGQDQTGMHWQSMKGGRGHYFEAERRGEPLEAAVILGGDPLLMLSAILPLPEDFDEIAFAGFLRGAPTPMVRAQAVDVLVPAQAEFILEGIVPPQERRVEGPFGDHFGHYSEAAEFPVFHLKRITRRRDAIYPASVVGQPPQEDKYMGMAAGEMIGPLIRVISPNIVDLHASVGAGFHNLLMVSLKERHPKEVLKTALSLLGTGQLSLTKVMILVREDVNPRRFDAVLRELWFRFEPQERLLLLPLAPLDTLDFTSFTMHVGSKLVLDASGEPVTQTEPPRAVNDPRTFDRRISRFKLLDGGFLVVVVEREPRDVLLRLIQWPDLGPVKFIVAVSPDVDLEDEENLHWGIFTRFDPARDMLFEEMKFLGARPVYSGRIAIDATWKQGYPLPLVMDEAIVRQVDARWPEYWR
jgi:4-hydroxy-3-polyprenylbenzoate decarboxylase